MKRWLPFTDWLMPYDRSYLSGDLTAGLTVGVMLIPQGMAYAMLAGMPAIYGLYAATVPLITYAVLGTSRQLAVGPVAMVAILIASGVGQLATSGSELYISYAILLALMVGVIQLIMGIFRLGFLVNFLAYPVISGFISAAAIMIGISQMKNILGLSIPRSGTFETVVELAQGLGDTNGFTLMIGAVAIFILVIAKKFNKLIPGPLIVVLLGIVSVYAAGLHQQGVFILGDIPQGLPSFIIPPIHRTAILELLPVALAISFVGFIQSMAMAKAIHAKHKDYQLIPDQELRALGLANILGSFFQSFPVTGGFSRSAVNDQAGARSGLSSIISAALIIFTLLFLTPYVYYLPLAVLSAIILVAVFGLIDFKEAKHLWDTDKQDFMLFMATAIVTLIVGIEQGIFTGVALSIIALVYNSSMPHIAELGEIGQTGIYRNLSRFPNARVVPDTSIIRMDAQLFFANATYFKERLEALAKKSHFIVIHCGSIQRLDSTAVHTISDLVSDFRDRGITILFSDMIGPVRDTLKKNGMFETIGKENFFISVKDAVDHIENSQPHEEYGIRFQTNN